MEKRLNKINIIMYSILFLMLIAFASASTYKQNNNVDIRHSVRTNGATTSTAICNITVYNPDWLVLVNFESMSYDSTTQTFNYTLINTSVVGDYCYDITCFDSGLNKTENFCIEITPTGKGFTIAQSITYLLLLAVVVGLFIFSLYGSIIIPFRNERNEYNEVIRINWKKYLKVFAIVMSYMFLIWVAYLSWNLAFGYLYLDSLAKFFNWIFVLLMALALPIFITVIIFFTVIYLQDKKIQTFIERGLKYK